MAPSVVMSLADVDNSTLAEVAESCDMPVTQIEDIYTCVPQQIEQIRDSRSEVFQVVLNFSSKADMDRWCEAVKHVVSQNSIFRTRLGKCRLGIVQVVTNEEHVTGQRSGNVEQYLCDEAEHHLGLGMPLFHSVVIGNDFVATMHHAIMDYWSLNSFLKEDVPLVYLGHPPKKRAAFKDFVALCVSVDESAAESFWASRFKGTPAIFPKVDPGFLPRPSLEVKKKIALKRNGNGISSSHIPSFVEAAWALTASIYADSENVAYGIVLSGRSSAFHGAETTLGPTVVEVPVQVHLQRSMTLERLIKDRATSMRQLTTNPLFLQYGVSRIGAVSEAAQTASSFQSLLNVVPLQPIALPVTEDESKSIRLDRVVKHARGGFGLMLLCRIMGDGILLEISYDPTVLCERQLHRVLNQFEHTFLSLTEASLAMRLDGLQRLNLHDRSEILAWNVTIPDMIEKTVQEIFGAQALARPEHVAVEAREGKLTYRELARMSDRLAHELQRRGVLPKQQVALVFGKSLWAIVAVLAVMKAGGVCVPVDETTPQTLKIATGSRLSSKIVLTSSLQQAKPFEPTLDVFVVNAESIASLLEVPGQTDVITSSSQDFAYMSCTSGSTGATQGILHEHRGIVSTLFSLAQRFDWQTGCRMLQLASLASNNGVCEVFGALLSGGCLCIPSEEDCESNLSGFVVAAKPNWALLPPILLGILSPSDMPSLESVLSIGQPVDAEAFEIWSGALRLFNGWGNSEASILSTVVEVMRGSQYPDNIGTPVGCAVWIVSPQNTDELAPIGGVGELLIESQGTTKSSSNGEVSTATSCIPPPQWASSCKRKGTQFYRTGDLGKYNPDGSISLVGSQRNRVKLSGQVIQLEEVERIIRKCVEVRDVVTLTKIAAGRTQLVAIVCLADPGLPRETVLQEIASTYARDGKGHLDTIRSFARSNLPPDRVPTLWRIVENMPRTASEGLDRAAVRDWLKGYVSVPLDGGSGPG